MSDDADVRRAEAQCGREAHRECDSHGLRVRNVPFWLFVAMIAAGAGLLAWMERGRS